MCPRSPERVLCTTLEVRSNRLKPEDMKEFNVYNAERKRTTVTQNRPQQTIPERLGRPKVCSPRQHVTLGFFRSTRSVETDNKKREKTVLQSDYLIWPGQSKALWLIEFKPLHQSLAQIQPRAICFSVRKIKSVRLLVRKSNPNTERMKGIIRCCRKNER